MGSSNNRKKIIRSCYKELINKIMGLFGFIGNAASATIKLATTPIAVVKDVGNITIGEEPTATEKHIKSIADSLEKTVDDLTGE